MSAQVNFTMPLCPITLEPMTEPVIDPEGNTYEKTAILEWIALNNNSPITRRPLRAECLVPNRALMEALSADIIKKITSETLKKTSSATAPCSSCGKQIGVSVNYKGKKAPTCFDCRNWNCKLCTYENKPNKTSCDMCKEARS